MGIDGNPNRAVGCPSIISREWIGPGKMPVDILGLD